MNVLETHLPIKQKLLRGNQQPFMSKDLSKAFMHRSKLKNLYNKHPSEDNEIRYKRQRNYCVNLLRREKMKYYNNLDLSVIKDSRTFWKNVKPLMSNKHRTGQKKYYFSRK